MSRLMTSWGGCVTADYFTAVHDTSTNTHTWQFWLLKGKNSRARFETIKKEQSAPQTNNNTVESSGTRVFLYSTMATRGAKELGFLKTSRQLPYHAATRVRGIMTSHLGWGASFKPSVPRWRWFPRAVWRVSCWSWCRQDDGSRGSCPASVSLRCANSGERKNLLKNGKSKQQEPSESCY